ncbi:MAG: TonB-dependent receptor [bacterium]
MKKWIVSFLFVGLLLSNSIGWAEKKSEDLKQTQNLETEAEKDQVYIKLGTVEVIAEKGCLASADIPASVDVVGSDQINNENVDFSTELMKKVPGTYYGDWNQGVISGTFSVRGFDANHDTPLALIVDGIPYNYAYGRLNMQPYFPMEIERMELIKGTNDPRYGLNNIAGNLNISTKQGGDEIKTKVITGSFDTIEADALVATEKNGLSQTYFIGYRSTDGYREHSDLSKGAISGKWFYTTEDEKMTLGTIARYFNMEANSPGYLTKEQSEQDPRQMQSFSRTDGGIQEDKHFSLHLDYFFADNLILSLKAYVQNMERTRWCKFTPTSSQQERVLDDTQYGVISTVSFETDKWFGKTFRLDWGTDYQLTESANQRFSVVDRVRSSTTRDWEYTSWYWGTYLKADAVFTDWIRLNAGLRMDHFDGDFNDKRTNKQPEMIDFGDIWQPKVGIVVTPYHGYNLYANWGRAFQLPSDNQRFEDQIGNNIDYSKNDGWELGVKSFTSYDGMATCNET